MDKSKLDKEIQELEEKLQLLKRHRSIIQQLEEIDRITNRQISNLQQMRKRRIENEMAEEEMKKMRLWNS